MNRATPSAVAIGQWRHLHLGDVGSTNTECLDRARGGDGGHLWITADRQLQGRGRRGRAWVSEAGNLYASLLLIDPAPVDRLASLPLVSAIAVHRAIQACLPQDKADDLKIKWPNDILVDGAKLSGILLESEILADGRRAVVLGHGVNVVHRPPAGLYRTSCLSDLGAATSADMLFAHLFQTMEEELAVWNAGEGLAATLRAWEARASGIGERITVNLTDRQLAGTFRGIDAKGRLVLLGENGQTTTIAAGDVFFGERASELALPQQSS